MAIHLHVRQVVGWLSARGIRLDYVLNDEQSRIVVHRGSETRKFGTRLHQTSHAKRG